MQTHRLDPSRTPMAAAVRWFMDQAEGGRLDCSGLLVVSPGARAGRVLVTLLATECQKQGLMLSPPVTTTAGRLAEALVPCDRPASEMHRLLAWREVLEGAPDDLLQAALPVTDTRGPWAEIVASASDECARGGLRFRDVASAKLPPLEPPERWTALAELQDRYETLLVEAGVADPLLHPLDSGEVVACHLRRLVMLCCTDLDAFPRRLIKRCDCPVDVLVAHNAGLHDDGVVDDAYWDQAEIEVDPGTVFVTGGPEEQGRLAVRAAMHLGTSAIGTADESLAGAIRRAATMHGINVHVAWGPNNASTGPGRMLADLALLLRERTFAALERVLRSDGFLHVLATRHPRAAALPEHLDEYLSNAMPTRAFGPLPMGGSKLARSRHAVGWARGQLLEIIQPLRQPPRRLEQWAGALERALIGLFEPIEDTLGDAAFATLETIGRGLREMATLPPTLDRKPVAADEALAMLLRGLEGRGKPEEPGGEALDVLGWLELVLDPSPALVVIGAHDQTLPSASTPAPLLAEGLRRVLGLSGVQRRLARDAAALSCLVATRHVHFVVGDHDAEGNPLLPSTLLLRGRGDGPARVLARGRDAFATVPWTPPPPTCGYRVRVLRPAPPPLTLPVTSFATYLRSPYEFYLRYVLGLREVEPLAIVPTMQANQYGSLLHDALYRFARDPHTRGITDEDQLRRMLHACLREAADQLAGERPSATMLAQIDTAERRLADVARVESQRRQAGWRTIGVEWKPEAPCELPGTGVCITGRIDRIDWHEGERRLALLDYKTSEESRNPASDHRYRDQRWKNLQLPLYELLARPIAAEREVEHLPRLGYFNLSGQGAHVRETGWDAVVVEDAHTKAVEIARAVASGIDAMRETGKVMAASVYARLAGVGMVLDGEHLEAGPELPS